MLLSLPYVFNHNIIQTDAVKIAAIKELARKEPKTNKERHIEDIIVDTEPASEPEEEIEVEIK